MAHSHGMVSFNSIEWIHIGIKQAMQASENQIFQFHWMDSGLKVVAELGGKYVFQFHWMDSTRLGLIARQWTHINSFNSIEWIPSFWNSSYAAPQICFQFHWMDSQFAVQGARTPRRILSIPLNGFCTITVYVHCGNSLISIIWILFHWPPVGGLMYTVESEAYMFFGFLSMVFPMCLHGNFNCHC